MRTPKVVFFTGSGISEESGVQTFRGNNGLWHEYKIEEVASLEGWQNNPGKVLEFYNKRRNSMAEVFPNKAHKDIGNLYRENTFRVSVITQNIDKLHERGGAGNVIHLHGRLDELRCSTEPGLIYPYNRNVQLGDTCKNGHQLRPNVVWFGENLNPAIIKESSALISEADYLVIVGTSLLVFPAAGLLYEAGNACSIYYIDPDEQGMNNTPTRMKPVKHIKEKAVSGVHKVIDEIRKKAGV